MDGLAFYDYSRLHPALSYLSQMLHEKYWWQRRSAA